MAVPAKESPPGESPSPVIPLIMLVIVIAMMAIPSMMAYDPAFYWNSTIAEVQTHFAVGAFLIPVCLVLAVQAFGMPHVNPIEPSPPSSPFVESISQDLPTSVTLVAIILFLFMLIPLRNVFQGPWQPPPPSARPRRWW